jgi:sulfotransferase family protein
MSQAGNPRSGAQIVAERSANTSERAPEMPIRPQPEGPNLSDRNVRPTPSPVFVLGCPRSGTTVLYHMLLSAGNFAVYRAESNVLNLLGPKFGNLSSARNRRRLLDSWLRSKLFRVTGLEARDIEQKIMGECRTPLDFLRITMEETARKQGVERWADCTPDHLLHIPEIHRGLPEARIIHIIRDGRDVALSYVKQNWAYPLPWDKHEHLAVAGMYWEWIVRRGREYGRRMGANYREVRFENLVEHPRETLAELGEFIGQDLDYDRIQSAGIGSVSAPNTSFQGEAVREGFHPVARWKTKLSPQEIANFEALVGGFLQQLGYSLSSERRHGGLRVLRLRSTYFPLFAAKQWLKMNSPLGRRVHTGRMEIT